MINSLFKNITSLFRAETRASVVVIRAATPRAAPYRSFTSKTVRPSTMASVQQTTVRKRVVGKKFVIACDGESRVASFLKRSMLTTFRYLDGKAPPGEFLMSQYLTYFYENRTVIQESTHRLSLLPPLKCQQT